MDEKALTAAIVTEVRGVITDSLKTFDARIASVETSSKSAVDKVEALMAAEKDRDAKMADLLHRIPAGGQRDAIHAAVDATRERRKTMNEQVRFMISNLSKAGSFDEGKAKALQIGIGSSGGFLVPVEITAEIVEKTYKVSAIAPNADVIEPAPLQGTGNREDGDFTWSSTAELAQPTETTFADLLKQFSWNLSKQEAFATIGNDLLRYEAADLMGWLGRKAPRSLAKKQDTWYMNGSGSGEPRGIRIAENVNAAVQAGATFDWPDLIDLEMALPQQYRDDAAFVVNDAGLKLIRKLATTTGEPVFASRSEGTRLGIDTEYRNNRGYLRLPGKEYPYFIVDTDALPANLGAGSATEIWFGVFMKYRIYRDGNLEMSQDSSGENWRLNQTQVKFTVREDGLVVLGEAWAKLTGVV